MGDEFLGVRQFTVYEKQVNLVWSHCGLRFLVISWTTRPNLWLTNFAPQNLATRGRVDLEFPIAAQSLAVRRHPRLQRTLDDQTTEFIALAPHGPAQI